MNSFIDANILLSFYDRSPSELEELRKIAALVKSGTIVLWLPAQVEDEFRRNRAKVLADARNGLADARLRTSLPAVASALPECATAELALKERRRRTHNC